ncbi:flavodoxin [Pediococcus siamensis]|uniref:flavodoxin n=1 Tax=Pediococcus siamensis TaxID=381829 RepID=UPI0039A09143
MTRKIILILGVIAVIAGAFWLDIAQSQPRSNNAGGSTQTSNQTSSKKSRTAVSQGDQTLIVFFSRSGTNYPHANLKHGHTYAVAKEIAQKTKGTRYEIIPQKAYPKDYEKTVDQAQEEQNENARPQIKHPIPDLTKYKTVFIGYPIWWDDIPMPVRTFMDQANLNGKTVIPFSTNAGSGWEDSLSTLHKKYPKAHFRKGFEIEGTEVNHATSKIDSWLQKLGY